MAQRSVRLSEREHTQALRLRLHCHSELCGGGSEMAGRRVFVHPSRADDVAEAFEWLCVREQCGGGGARSSALQPDSGTAVHGLARARALLDSGYECEARELLLSVVGAADHGGRRVDAPAIQAAQGMLRGHGSHRGGQ
ncbi:hypothetical protein GGF46_000822 [Coemansia sp. RSA 552]|nr:hypothetical protein GGF46_000822 [Coemansia sp. RSA 552]